MEFGRLMIMADGEQYSIIRRAWLTKIFVLGDVISFFAQFIGKTSFLSGRSIPIASTRGSCA